MEESVAERPEGRSCCVQEHIRLGFARLLSPC